MRRDTANGDFQMKFSYRDTSGIPGPETQIRYRYADANTLGLLRIFPTAFRVEPSIPKTPKSGGICG